MGKKKTKAQKVNDKAKRLRQKEKALHRAGAMIQATGDKVMGAAADVNTALSDAKTGGIAMGLTAAKEAVDGARTIGSARKAVDALLAEAKREA